MRGLCIPQKNLRPGPSLPDFTMLPSRPDKHCGDLHNEHAPTHQRSVDHFSILPLVHLGVESAIMYFLMKMHLEMHINLLFLYLNAALKALFSCTFLVCNSLDISHN